MQILFKPDAHYFDLVRILHQQTRANVSKFWFGRLVLWIKTSREDAFLNGRTILKFLVNRSAHLKDLNRIADAQLTLFEHDISQVKMLYRRFECFKQVVASAPTSFVESVEKGELKIPNRETTFYFSSPLCCRKVTQVTTENYDLKTSLKHAVEKIHPEFADEHIVLRYKYISEKAEYTTVYPNQFLPDGREMLAWAKANKITKFHWNNILYDCTEKEIYTQILEGKITRVYPEWSWIALPASDPLHALLIPPSSISAH